VDLEAWATLLEKGSGCEGLVGRYVAAGCHHCVEIAALVVGGPILYSHPLGAVRDGVIYVEELQVILLIRHDDINVVGRLEAVVHDREKTVSVRRQVHTNHIETLVGNDVEEVRVLVRKAIVILSPDSGSREDVKRGYLLTSFHLKTIFKPLVMLIDYGVDDVDEGLATTQKTMPTREDGAF
jgi:hypothetical protein